MIVYWTGGAGNTERFVKKLGQPSVKITKDLVIDYDCVLIIPTYGLDADIPAPVKSFLNIKSNRKYIKAVVGTGNRNFGSDFAGAAKTVSKKLRIPLIDTVELAGNEMNVERVNKWYRQHITKQTI